MEVDTGIQNMEVDRGLQNMEVDTGLQNMEVDTGISALRGPGFGSKPGPARRPGRAGPGLKTI